MLAKFDFDNIIKRMVESNTLYLVIKEFGSEKGYLGPDKISGRGLRLHLRGSGAAVLRKLWRGGRSHFTSRDIIYLMTDLLLSEATLTPAA